MMSGQLKAGRAGQRLTLRVNAGAGVDLTTVTAVDLLVRDRALEAAQVEWAATFTATASRIILTRITDGTESGSYAWCVKLYVSGDYLTETIEDSGNLIVFTPSAFT